MHQGLDTTTYLRSEVLDELLRRERRGLRALTHTQLDERLRNRLADVVPRMLAVLAKVEARAPVPDALRVLRDRVKQHDVQVRDCADGGRVSRRQEREGVEHAPSSMCTSGQMALPAPTTPPCFLSMDALIKFGIWIDCGLEIPASTRGPEANP